MDFAHSPRTTELLERLIAFQEREIAPREETYHREVLASADPWTSVPSTIEELKALARERGVVEPVPHTGRDTRRGADRRGI